MTTSIQTGSAKIYKFPAGGRQGAARQQEAEKADRLAAAHVPVTFGSWYHEAAIQESDQGRKQ
ncbi:DUF2735 domain-containing protein [Aquabacter spiritensis]|uniref:Uncharacterized protein DUF2735 n=1 Tax=Aquabacter spiritensis TaxID=933073 RepID=A0A4R3LY53_9HYPH|nr:DUF2735 domain-containing protein [Aquabacter spiritensis]TCT05453.1 uncharacterized protein DUF2735 [Aquabacter spiritensis]